MSFTTNELQPRGSGEAKEFPKQDKLRWLYLKPGNYQVRLLQSDYKSVYTHWVNGVNIECLGEDSCPICLENRKIIAENPKTFRQVEGFNPYRVTCYVNVYDRTPVKVCPKCGAETYRTVDGVWPQACSACGEFIGNVEAAPSNKVKVFSRSKGAFEAIGSTHNTIFETTGKSITDYDITIAVRPQSGRGTNINIIPQTHLNDVLTGMELFDLDRATIKLESAEIIDLIRGVSLRDIFAARKVEEEASSLPFGNEPVPATPSQQVASDLTQQASDFLKKFQ